MFELPELPYKIGNMEPLFSKEQLRAHYAGNHAKYVEKLNNLTKGTPHEQQTLEQIIIESRTEDRNLFNNAAQHWNHCFLWNCIKPEAAGSVIKIDTEVGNIIRRDFGTDLGFHSAFITAAMGVFGSGWCWLVLDKDTKKLKITTTANAENPIGTNEYPLLTVDIWEHSHYIDFQSKRNDYLKRFLRQVNWGFVAKRWQGR